MSGFVARAAAAAVALGLVALGAPTVAAASTSQPAKVITVAGSDVAVPAPGTAVAVSVDRIVGASTTRVISTDLNGAVTVSDGVEADAATEDAAADDAAPNDAPDKCSDSAYALITGSKWSGTYGWRFRTASTPKGLTVAEATRALRLSIGNITKAHNDCGLADEVSASAHYLGSTTLPSDATSTSGCGAPSMQNVTEFAPIDGTNILAVTCVYTAGPNIVSASVRINTNVDWELHGKCTSAYGVLATMTHEYGHAFGLAHVDETAHRNLTMSSAINSDCSNFEAHLGKGDVLALRSLY